MVSSILSANLKACLSAVPATLTKSGVPAAAGAIKNGAVTRSVGGLELDRNLGGCSEPDHAASCVYQARKKVGQAKIVNGLERSDRKEALM